jgi:hypothetical protein
LFALLQAARERRERENEKERVKEGGEMIR